MNLRRGASETVQKADIRPLHPDMIVLSAVAIVMMVDKEVPVSHPQMLVQMQPYTFAGERRNTGMHVESSAVERSGKGAEQIPLPPRTFAVGARIGTMQYRS
jgi:hypothetical protein